MEKRRDMGEKTGIVIAGAAILDVVADAVGPEGVFLGAGASGGAPLFTGGGGAKGAA